MGSSTNHLAGSGAEFYRFYRWIIQMLSTSSCRQGYKRLNVRQSTKRRRARVVQLGRRRSFKIKRFPITIARLRWRWWWRVSPLKLLAKLRDAYVNLLLAASSNPFPSHRNAPFGYTPPKEYEKKILVELYKSMAQEHLIVPRHL